MVTLNRVIELLSYDPETGEFRWRCDRGLAREGNVAGSPDKDGYIKIGIDRKRYAAHRLAWLMSTRRWPAAEQIDHRNGDRSDNRLANLREATRSKNKANSGAYKTNSSGLKGVSWNRQKRKWHAQIQVAGTKYHLGNFKTTAEAYAAYCQAAATHFGEFARAA